MKAQARALLRLAAVLFCVARGAWALWRHQKDWSAAQRAQAVNRWANDMLRALGVTLQVHGQPGSGPLFWVANHIAWLDILAVHAVRHCRFVAKSEVHHWPMIGRMAAEAGTLFIERASRRDALRVVHDMAAALQSGDTVAVFPEGTTSTGETVLPFHANLLQAAIVTGAPVQPILIRYLNEAGHMAKHVRFVGEDTLAGSIWRVLMASATCVCLDFLEPQHDQGRDRRAWARDLREVMLNRMQ
jgi:1-acyl-sn-glycerol-3-phosphate acyltransferase